MAAPALLGLDPVNPLKSLHTYVNKFERSPTLKDEIGKIKKLVDSFKQLLVKFDEAQANTTPYLKKRAVENLKKDFKKKCEEFYEVNKTLPKTLEGIKQREATVNKYFDALRDHFEKNLDYDDVDYIRETLAPRLKKIATDFNEKVMKTTDEALETASKMANKLGIPLEIAPAAPKKDKEKPWYQLAFEYANAEKGVAVGAALGLAPIFMRPSWVVQHPNLMVGSTLAMFGAFAGAKTLSEVAMMLHQKEASRYLSETAKTFYVASSLWGDILGGKFGYSAAHPAAAIAIGAAQLGALALMTDSQNLRVAAGLGLTAAASVGLGESAGVAVGAATLGAVTSHFVSGLKEKKKENDKWVDTNKARYEPYVGKLIGTAVASVGIGSAAITYFTKQAVADVIVNNPYTTAGFALGAAALVTDASVRGIGKTVKTMTGPLPTVGGVAAAVAAGSIAPSAPVFWAGLGLAGTNCAVWAATKAKEVYHYIRGQ